MTARTKLSLIALPSAKGLYSAETSVISYKAALTSLRGLENIALRIPKFFSAHRICFYIFHYFGDNSLSGIYAWSRNVFNIIYLANSILNKPAYYQY